ncbi:MAG TPA: hypothetical protein VMX97_09345 [Hyphomicrobiaceae bacterium]|nr:hypothetical protein [Hyphomicrobiaceae bacterium]
MNEAKQTRRMRWVPVLGVILLVGGCQLPSGLTASVPSELVDGIQTMQSFFQDFTRQMIAAIVL